MVKYIVGGVIVLLSWALAIIIEFPYWIPSLITLVVVLVLLLLVGIEKLRERRAARELERALAAQAAQQAATARPDLQHDIAAMNAEFQKAVAALKTSKKGGKKALYALPWYTIIGPPGCGKSTALRNSGLQFPYLSASGGGVRGLGGTRNCDWWMTSEAVILDTAGRWTSEDEDRDEWLAFLDLIRRFRPKKPLNGIIAAVSVGDLGGQRDEETLALARRVRDRIDEVQGRLQMSLPVYVLFTKCDLIPGFVETFGEMSKEERGQAWGYTAPLSRPIGPPSEYFSRGFDQLVTILERRSLRRMGEERKIANREMIYAFPQQIAVIKQNLQDFVHNLFLENVFKETPRLRGIYFTSGTQEGRPIDRVMSRMAEAFGQPQVQLPAPQVEAKSYFLRDTFANVVFKDAEVAVRSPEEVRRQRRNTYLAAGIIFLFALGMSGLPAMAWSFNRSFLSETREIVDAARAHLAHAEPEPLDPSELVALHRRTALLDEHDGGPPLHMSMGMYQDEVFEPVRGFYLDLLRRRVVQPIVEHDASEMDAFGRRFEATAAPPEAQELRASYNRLKLHLLLSVPRDEEVGEPELNDTLEEFVRSQLVTRWATATETRRSHQEKYALINDAVHYYVSHVRRHPELTFARDATAVGRVRGVFAAVGGFEMAVEGIIEEMRPRGPDMTLIRMVGRGVTMMRATRRVRFAFTRDAWDRWVRTMLETDAARFFGEHWVLGQPPPASPREEEILRAQQVQGLRSYFLERYVQEWRELIASIEMVRPTQITEHHLQLAQLTSGEPMRITTLIRQIDREVTLDALPAAGRSRSGAAADAAQRELGRAVKSRLTTRLGATGTRQLTEAARNEANRRLGVPELPPDAMTPQRVREQFAVLLDFAPDVRLQQPQDGQPRQVTPARVYEEQLEYLRDSAQFRIDGTNITDYDALCARARSETQRLLLERPSGEWRDRLTTLLMPPVECPYPMTVAAPGTPPVPGTAVPGPAPTTPTTLRR